MKRLYKAIIALVPIYLGLIGLVWFATVVEENLTPPHQITWGVTFVPSYAEFLGTDPRESLQAILDELGVRNFRLTLPWDQVEPQPDQFTFGQIEWQLDELGKRGGQAVVAIGRRTPRWPECHDPQWVKNLSTEEQESAVLSLIQKEVEALRHRKEIVAWQVENEPLLRVFGKCPRHSKALLEKEIALVRGLDPARPVYTTESGELSTWTQTAPLVDALGISLYRQTYNRFLGKLYYPLTPAFYRRRAESIAPLLGRGRLFISELQGEPWSGEPLPKLPIDEQLALMSGENLRANIAFAAATGIPEVYLWGVEWWYSLKKQDVPELWDAAGEVFPGR